jgi:[acyl-carrier-protein] S-malonyltransferase
MRAVVFPGQGTPGGGFSGEVEEAVRAAVGGGEGAYQLSVFAASVETYRRLLEAGFAPDVVAGHSLGEYAAAHAAGALGLEDAARLVAERDRLMTEAARENPGVMVAVLGASAGEVVEAIGGADGVVVAANFNTPRQTVVSGDEEAVEAALARVRGRKRRLDVAGAFHSPMMREASVGMERLLDEVAVRDPEVPMVSGMDGALLARAEDVRLALRGQMLSPVRWVAVVERLRKMGVEEMIEAGGGTLVRMLRDFEVSMRGRKAEEVLS